MDGSHQARGLSLPVPGQEGSRGRRGREICVLHEMDGEQGEKQAAEGGKGEQVRTQHLAQPGSVGDTSIAGQVPGGGGTRLTQPSGGWPGLLLFGCFFGVLFVCLFVCCFSQRLGRKHNAGGPPAAADGTGPLLSPGRRRRLLLEKGRLWLPRTRRQPQDKEEEEEGTFKEEEGALQLWQGGIATRAQGWWSAGSVWVPQVCWALLAFTVSPFPTA